MSNGIETSFKKAGKNTRAHTQTMLKLSRKNMAPTAVEALAYLVVCYEAGASTLKYALILKLA